MLTKLPRFYSTDTVAMKNISGAVLHILDQDISPGSSRIIPRFLLGDSSIRPLIKKRLISIDKPSNV